MKPRELVLAAIVALVACTSSEPAPGTAPKPIVARRAEGGELMLRRTMCYGECPAYTVFVDAEGDVFYHGRDYAERQGLHTGTVDPDRVQLLLGLALDTGYFDADHDYEERITDNPTVYSSVVVDGRRHWVRNYARAAPDSVSAIEIGIDGLLEHVSWHPTPRRLAAAGDTPCNELARAIETRCRDVLTLRGRGGDCSFWLEAWNGLAPDMPGQSLERERCARKLHSLEAASAPAIVPEPEVRLGPKCRKWFDATLGDCHRHLRRGEVGMCSELDKLSRIVLADLHDPGMDAEARQRMAEIHCDMMVH